MAGKTPEIIEVDAEHLNEFMLRAKDSLANEDYELLDKIVLSYSGLVGTLQDNSISLRRLRKMLFGSSSEKTAAVTGEATGNNEAEATADSSEENTPADTVDELPKKKPKGHGRNGADAYEGAERIVVPHETLSHGDLCPDCLKGHVYKVALPGVLVRIVGQAPLNAKVYELEKHRCNLCNTVFTAEPPAGVGPEKYNFSAASMIALLKYGSGLPFNRLQGLQKNLGIPLPAATQWDVIHNASHKFTAVYEEFIRQGANGELLQNDDTSVRILEMMGKRAAKLADNPEWPTNKDGSRREGIYTSGVVSTRDGQQIALYFSGKKHAGENLMHVLMHRSQELPPPLQMCDALNRNLPGEFETIVANCLAHGRRKFVDVHESFPKECRHVLDTLAQVYKNDADAKQEQLSPEERLTWHQEKSQGLMADLHQWLKSRFETQVVEPNSELGYAINYMLHHWKKLTMFLKKAGAPLDNNLCERILKKAILHRKNAMFYKTQNGADVGDMYMSLIHTCELCGANPFEYLNDIQHHHAEAQRHPERWMPWNYKSAAQQAVSSG